MHLLDIILGYDCNLACDYCTITPEMRRRELATAAVVAAMHNGRRDGYDWVSFSGGEPTLRRDLLGLVRAARQLGFATIRVQSNGLLLAEPRNLDRLIAAGVNKFHVSIHTHLEEAYDRLVRRPDSYRLMVAALDQLVARGVDPTADVIIKRDTYRELPAATRWLHDHGVRRVDFWLVSLTDANRAHPESLPRMSELMPSLAEALAWAAANDMVARSLHLPRCALGDAADHAYDPGNEDVRVVTPEATFSLRTGKITPQVQVAACAGCVYCDVCPGVRRDYLERYGEGEIAPVTGSGNSDAEPGGAG